MTTLIRFSVESFVEFPDGRKGRQKFHVLSCCQVGAAFLAYFELPLRVANYGLYEKRLRGSPEYDDSAGYRAHLRAFDVMELNQPILLGYTMDDEYWLSGVDWASPRLGPGYFCKRCKILVEDNAGKYGMDINTSLRGVDFRLQLATLFSIEWDIYNRLKWRLA